MTTVQSDRNKRDNRSHTSAPLTCKLHIPKFPDDFPEGADEDLIRRLLQYRLTVLLPCLEEAMDDYHYVTTSVELVYWEEVVNDLQEKLESVCNQLSEALPPQYPSLDPSIKQYYDLLQEHQYQTNSQQVIVPPTPPRTIEYSDPKVEEYLRLLQEFRSR
ncbi:hypothetical protein BGX21_004441, partial [Mortierella sp. AD011]